MPERRRSSCRIGSIRRLQAPGVPEGGLSLRRGSVGTALAIGLLVLQFACQSLPPGRITLHIPEGDTFSEVLDSLEAHQAIGNRGVVHLYARLRGLDRSIKAGTYRIERGAPVGELLEVLTTGRVVTRPMTIPEGFTIRSMASRIAAATGLDSAGVAGRLGDPGLHERWRVPGPGLEGYLFPDTYRFAEGIALETVVTAMTEGYRRYWTPERQRRLEELGMSEGEAVTLASIVQAEARHVEEMPTISSVFHNRLQIGMRLQADPTVLYALGGHRARLLYAAIDSVEDHPYNTYSHVGLPPGPIGAPGSAALDAALHPLETDYFYFVAEPNGTHIFTRTHNEHLRAKARVERADDAPARSPGGAGTRPRQN